MANGETVFDLIEGGESTDLFQPDYTGANADYYLNKYVNSPENMGNLDGLQNSLHAMGVVAPPADALNAAIYLYQKEYGMAALSVASIVPFITEIGKGFKYLQNIKKKVILYRGIKVLDNVDEMLDASGKKIVGNWKQSSYGRNVKSIITKSGEERVVFDGVVGKFRGRHMPVMTTFPKDLNWDKLLFTTTDYKTALRYATSSKGGLVLKFEVPVNYINKHARKVTGRRFLNYADESKDALDVYPSVLFSDGLPYKFLQETENMAQMPISRVTKRLYEEAKKHPEYYKDFDPVHFLKEMDF